MFEVEYGIAHAIQADRTAKALSASYVLGETAPRSWASWFGSLFSNTEVVVPNQEWSNGRKAKIGQYR